jgi:DNA invertase Pin-like site-specific DNA recombinase
MPTAHIYVRVSTDGQDLSPEWQRQVCERHYETNLKGRGYVLNTHVFEDRQSARSVCWADRDAGRELFKVVTAGDVILAAKQDRVWRSVRDKENSLFFLGQMGIEIVILDMNIDTTTASGKFAAGIVALQAQWESDVRSERMKAAFAVRRARKTPRKKHPPPGWKFDKTADDWVPDLRERRLLEQIYRWRENRVRGIKKTCKVLRQEGVRRDNGGIYHNSWVMRAYRCYVMGWPLEGYHLYKPCEEGHHLPQFGKDKVTLRDQELTRAELERICGALPSSHEPASPPDESLDSPASPAF